MNQTSYRAMQIARPGVLERVERAVPTPGPGHVLIAVDACGICGADARDIEHVDPAACGSRIPGHEVVGRIAALGPDVPPLWTIGQRVGVGRLGGHCNACAPCRQGNFQLCENQPVVGSTCDGGYAEMMLARSTGLVSIPDELDAEEAAPILCAGIATFNALRKSGAEPGDVVAILGIGGLGHMAVQYARRMGFKVVAIGRGSDIAADAMALGAHVYIDSRAEDAAARLRHLGGARDRVDRRRWRHRLRPVRRTRAPGPPCAAGCGQGSAIGVDGASGRWRTQHRGLAHRNAVRKREGARVQRVVRRAPADRSDAARAGERRLPADAIGQRQIPHGSVDGAYGTSGRLSG